MIQNTDDLLGSIFAEYIKNTPDVNSILSTHLEENSNLFKKKLKKLPIKTKTVSDINDSFKVKLTIIEKKLQILLNCNSIDSKKNLEKISGVLLGMCPDNIKEVYCLKKDIMIFLLKENKPKRLMVQLEKKTIEELITTIEPSKIISLTRHTESKKWLQDYKKQLGKLNASHFEKRKIQINIIDNSSSIHLLELKKHHQKPWLISHNKEAGTITCFAHNNIINFPLPILMFTVVFFHYFFEISYAGLFNKYTIKVDPENVGNRFIDSISNNEHLSFFNPHSYSESLYWDKALELFHQKFDFDELNFFSTTAFCGDFVDDKIVSFNLIDQIWNINFPYNKKFYCFKTKSTPNFTYHFQEMYWFNIFPKILNISNNDMVLQIIKNEDNGDSLFTKKMLRKYTI